MEDEQVLQAVSNELEVVLNEKNYTFARQILAERINELINSDFQKLVSILYRADISEAKLKQLLKTNPGTDAGLIIADLMIERQEQKIRSRQEYKRDENISDDERW
jgi:hypothetical protein